MGSFLLLCLVSLFPISSSLPSMTNVLFFYSTRKTTSIHIQAASSHYYFKYVKMIACIHTLLAARRKRDKWRMGMGDGGQYQAWSWRRYDRVLPSPPAIRSITHMYHPCPCKPLTNNSAQISALLCLNRYHSWQCSGYGAVHQRMSLLLLTLQLY